MKGANFMEIAFSRNGWINIKTDKIIPFGNIAVDFYNTIQKGVTHIRHKLCHNLNIHIQPWFFDGRDAPRCNAQAQIFKSNQDIVAIIWSEKEIQKGTHLTYLFDGHNRYYKGKNVYYIPLYKNDFLNLFGKNEFYNLLITKYWAFENVLNLVEFMANHVDRPYYTKEEYHKFTMQVLDSHIISFKLNTELRKYKNSYVRVYALYDIQELLFDDIVQMIDFKYSLEFCPICGNAFVKRDKRRNFCPTCSKDQKKIKQYNDQKRKSSLQYLHKIITDMLRNRQEEYNEFVNESHYYSDIVNGKDIEYNPKYNQPIKTESDYRKWLERKHEEYMVRKK